MVETSDQLRKRLELQDHGHELAGLQTGRMTRFGIGDGVSGSISEKERKERAYRDALARLLAEDAVYRALYEDLGNRLRDAETEADTTIEATRIALLQTQQANADMRSRAPKVDGLAVFRYADGRVVDENGNEIDEAIGAGIIWPDDVPTAEDYFASVEREAELSEALSEWENYRNDTLGYIRHRYDDRDNPNTMDAMREYIEAIEQSAPEVPELNASNMDAATPMPTASSVPIPDLSS